ncbi:unnamed protein product [Didymodactylos carnosus]|uniref:Telomerase reverse transcriptase n=1 Tax=Didymodactylos carnosus TaxID=1234261 RepID=A0A813WSC2_9BILA|nr:unnamed protein product [Didymodactylos carnosus]CAF0859685.1 unnamed protein product [Didymodactylos carnosus]CAF3537808.1 unnamed protein product [Didymodactylos carnosus]CAF3647356.1 unnamed protein product [Didymodactylos carnosus]
MNIIQASNSSVQSLSIYFDDDDEENKKLFENVYICLSTSSSIDQNLKRFAYEPQDENQRRASTEFLKLLLTRCYECDTWNHLFSNLSFYPIKIFRQIRDKQLLPDLSDSYIRDLILHHSSILSRLIRSQIWNERRLAVCDDFLLHLFSKHTVFECVIPEIQTYVKLSGNSKFDYLPRWIKRRSKLTTEEYYEYKRQNEKKVKNQITTNIEEKALNEKLTELCQKCYDRKQMLYRSLAKERFDTTHKLEFIKPKTTKSDIYTSFFKFDLIPQKQKESIENTLSTIFYQLHCNHHSISIRHQHLPYRYTRQSKPQPTASLDQLVPLRTPTLCVRKLIRYWLEHLLPVELFGDVNNKKSFIRYICLFVLSPRKQRFLMNDFLHCLNLSEIKWYNHQTEWIIGKLYLCLIIDYLIDYVITLVRSYFYITELAAPSHPSVLTFYSHRIWSRLYYLAQKELIDNYCFPDRIPIIPLLSDSNLTQLQTDDIHCFWKIRIVPKHDSVRCITRPLITEQYLSDTKELLKYFRINHSHLLGISVFSRTEMYNKWKQFMDNNKTTNNNEKIMYFLRTDLKSFYDSINIYYLYKSVEQFLDDCQFDYNLIIRKISAKTYRAHRLLIDKFYLVHREDEHLSDIFNNNGTKYNERLRTKFRNAIITDEGVVDIYGKSKLLKYIHAQIFSENDDIVAFLLFSSYLCTRSQSTSYRRCSGINHGLKIAPVLGAIYLSNVEKDVQLKLLPDEFGCRHADDILIMSPHRYRLRRIKIKYDKTLMTLGHKCGLIKTKNNLRRKGNVNDIKSRPISYWGCLINVQTREILVDKRTTMEMKCQQIMDEIWLDTHENSYRQQFRSTVSNDLYLKSNIWYFDLSYNSLKTFYRNFFYLSCYFINRLHSMCSRFYQIHSYSYKINYDETNCLSRLINNAFFILYRKACFVNKNTDDIKRARRVCKYLFVTACCIKLRTNKSFYPNLIIKRLTCQRQRLRINRQTLFSVSTQTL